MAITLSKRKPNASFMKKQRETMVWLAQVVPYAEVDEGLDDEPGWEIKRGAVRPPDKAGKFCRAPPRHCLVWRETPVGLCALLRVVGGEGKPGASTALAGRQAGRLAPWRLPARSACHQRARARA